MKPLIQLLLFAGCLTQGLVSAQTLVDFTIITDKLVPRTIFEPNLRGNPPFSDGGPAVGLGFHVRDIPANSSVRYRYLRPDGSLAFDSGAVPFSGSAAQPSPFYSFSVCYYLWPILLNRTGTWRITADLNGAPFITNATFTVGGGYTISTVAGSGNGDGGLATAAFLANPSGVAVDSAGNLYLAEVDHNRVRKITPAGVISTVAGTGLAAFNGDGIPATSAYLNLPGAVAVDAAGALYISDSGNNCVRKIGPDGIITTVAGPGLANTLGDGGAATSAYLSSPQGLTFDSAGNLYIADRLNHRVRKVTPAGIISTIAGTGVQGFNGDGVATRAQLNLPFAVCVDANSNLYIADFGNYSVRKVSPSGILSTVAGAGFRGSGGDGFPATTAALSEVIGVVADAGGNLYISDYSNSVIRISLV